MQSGCTRLPTGGGVVSDPARVQCTLLHEAEQGDAIKGRDPRLECTLLLLARVLSRPQLLVVVDAQVTLLRVLPNTPPTTTERVALLRVVVSRCVCQNSFIVQKVRFGNLESLYM